MFKLMGLEDFKMQIDLASECMYNQPMVAYHSISTRSFVASHEKCLPHHTNLFSRKTVQREAAALIKNMLKNIEKLKTHGAY